MKITDTILNENAVLVVNISQPKRRQNVKCYYSCVLDVFRVNRTNNGRDARTHRDRSGKNLFEKRVFARKYSKRKAIFKTRSHIRDIKRSARRQGLMKRKIILKRVKGLVHWNRCKQTYFIKGN